MKDNRFEKLEDLLGFPVWCGRTSGGYGNGPYRKTIKAGGECPRNRVIGHFGDCDVVEAWAPAVVSDVKTSHDINDIVLSIDCRSARAFDLIKDGIRFKLGLHV